MKQSTQRPQPGNSQMRPAAAGTCATGTRATGAQQGCARESLGSGGSSEILSVAVAVAMGDCAETR